MKLTIGTDLETMLKRNGRIISAIPVFAEHDKCNRLDLGEGIHGFPDNVNAEFTIPPASSSEELVSNIGTLFRRANNFLKTKDCELVIKAAHNFDESELDCDEARVFGCRPETISYLSDDNKYIQYDTPNAEQIGNLRVCGGHIHIGRSDYKTCNWDAFLISLETKIWAARAMDLFVGVPLTFLDTDPSSTIRKKLYGRAGSIRDDLPYGFEYRTLSNFWAGQKETIELVYELTVFAINFAEQNPGLFAQSNKDVPFNSIREAIDTGNKAACKKIIEKCPLTKALKKKVLTTKVNYTGKANL